jgi:tetratricopeptide (TPR) repeat protein
VTYGSGNPAWRAGAHGRGAAALRNCYAPLPAQAHHTEGVAQFGDLATVRLLSEAASTVQMQAPGTAAQWLRAAIRLCPEGAGPEQRTALLFRLAFALGAAGHPRESRDTLRAALLAPGAGRHQGRAAAVAFCAHLERRLGRHCEGQALLLAELSALPDQATAAAAAVKFELGCGELDRGDHTAARRWAQEALATLRLHGPAGMRAATAGLLAATHATCGDATAAVTHAAEAASLLDGMLDRELGEQPAAALWLGWSELFLGRPVSALRHLDRALALIHDNGQVPGTGMLLIARVLALRLTGRLTEACTAVDEAADAALLASDAGQQAAVRAMRCYLAALTGELDPALAAATVRPGGLPEPPSTWLAALAAKALAEARLAIGDPEGCLALGVSPAGAGSAEAPDWAMVGWYELLTRAELAVGNQPAATRWADAAAAAARNASLPGRSGLALLAQAQAATSADPEAAHGLAVAARHALGSAGMSFDTARATLAAAEALAACGDLDRAGAGAQAAQAAFQSCGAVPLARSAAILRRRVSASHPRNRSDEASASIRAGQA